MRYVLCAPPYCKCPVLVKMENGEWFLHDDYGNRVILTHENLVQLKQALEDALKKTEEGDEQ